MFTKLFIALLFLAVRVQASSLDLTNWVGRYPYSHDKGFQNIFDVPDVRQALRKMLTHSELKLLTQTYATTMPIQLMQNHVVVECCKPHDCPAEHAMLVIDLKHQRFHVGFYRGYYQETTRIKWISSDGEFQDLPKEIHQMMLNRLPQANGFQTVPLPLTRRI
jgi:hypothetical protein